MFKLKLKKVVVNSFKGYRGYQIIGWEGGFSLDELPIEYKQEKQMFFAVEKEVIYLYNFPSLGISSSWMRKYGSQQTLDMGHIYSYDALHEIVGYMKECGNRLSEIRKQIKKLKEEWKGEVEIII